MNQTITMHDSNLRNSEEHMNNPEEFIIRPGKKEEIAFVSRTFNVSKDILDRIDNLAKDNWQYSKKAIINQLLDDALKKYGY